MSEMLNTLLRTAMLDDGAFQEWRERPNLFLRGLILIALVTLVAGLLVFAVNLWNGIKPVDMFAEDMESQFDQFLGDGFPASMIWQNVDPKTRAEVTAYANIIKDMVTEVAQVEAPLPRGINGFLKALGGYVTRVVSAWGGWMFYAVLVLIAVNLLGGSAKIPDFLGMTALYSVPALLGILSVIPCVGGLLVLIATIWSLVVYSKAVSVASDLSTGRSIVAVIAPFVVMALLAFLLALLWGIWLSVVFS